MTNPSFRAKTKSQLATPALFVAEIKPTPFNTFQRAGCPQELDCIITMAEDGSPVKLYVYDLSNGMARAMSASLIGTHIDGIWHTSIVVVRVWMCLDVCTLDVLVHPTHRRPRVV